MIYTITFNPAIDYVMHNDTFLVGRTNRSTGEELYYGGKGINVSMCLANLSVESVALGFVAGFTGTYLEQGLADLGIKTDFIHLESGITRINVKLKGECETEINGCGPDITKNELEKLNDKLVCLKDGDTLVLAGSIPASLPQDTYERIVKGLEGKSVRIIADATGELLIKVLKYRPFLVKPNLEELEEIFGESIDESQVFVYARRLREMGAKNVLVSMAEKGAVLVCENGAEYVCDACKGQVKNSVGAGDSMIAGFIAGFERGGYECALKLGVACGSATAFSQGIAGGDMIAELFGQICT